jgi:hypothetical protein
VNLSFGFILETGLSLCRTLLFVRLRIRLVELSNAIVPPLSGDRLLIGLHLQRSDLFKKLVTGLTVIKNVAYGGT